MNWRQISETKIELDCETCGKSHQFKASPEIVNKKSPIKVLCPSVDRRFKLSLFIVDSRRNILKNDDIKNLSDIQTQLKEGLKKELGSDNFEQKFKRWLSIDYPSLGISEEYISLLNFCINSYCIGHFFPSMTSTGALIERILNRLVLRLRKYHSDHPKYSKFSKKDSFQNWDFIIPLLEEWEILPNEKSIKQLNKLKEYRNKSIHYTENYDFETKSFEMLKLACEFIDSLWSVFERTDIFFNAPGEFYVKKSGEEIPFVKEFIIPMCVPVSAHHQIDKKTNHLVEVQPYFEKLTDHEFRNKRIEFEKNNN